MSTTHLLARRGGSAEYGESFGDSEAAMLLPDLLGAGMRVTINYQVTVWAQLRKNGYSASAVRGT
jgi:hypothetical protein